MASLFGLALDNLGFDDAVRTLGMASVEPSGRTRVGCFVNAHAARLAAADLRFHDALARADWRLPDGIGVRLALRLRGVRLRANLVGTDLIPALLDLPRPRPGRLFLLGGTDATNAAAARHAAERFPGWIVAGRRHGFGTGGERCALVDAINAARPDLLLVGLGNPRQELWLDHHRDRLAVPLALAVGGLFRHWSGELARASALTRRLGLEWLQLCRQHPARSGRYLIGGPVFVARALVDAGADRARARAGSLGLGRTEAA